MMTEAEREHVEHTYEREDVMCAQEASMDCSQHNSRTGRLITAAMQCGLFLVVMEYPWHCRSTDAVIGTGKGIASMHLSRREAEKALANEYGDCDACQCDPRARPSAIGRIVRSRNDFAGLSADYCLADVLSEIG